MFIASSFDLVIPWILVVLIAIVLFGATSIVLSAKGHWLGMLFAFPLLVLGIAGVRSLLMDSHKDTLIWEAWAINLSPLVLCAMSVALWFWRRLALRRQDRIR
jgi:hypothetical protein